MTYDTHVNTLQLLGESVDVRDGGYWWMPPCCPFVVVPLQGHLRRLASCAQSLGMRALRSGR